MLKLKLQYFGHLIRRGDSLEKTPMLGGIGPETKFHMAWNPIQQDSTPRTHTTDTHPTSLPTSAGPGKGGL